MPAWIALVGSALYLGSFILDSPLRFAFASVGLAQILYLRDGFVPLLVAMMVCRGLYWRSWPITPLVVLALIGVHSFLGSFLIGNPAQVLYGVKVVLPFVGGILAGTYISQNGRRLAFQRICLALWLVAILGVAMEASGIQFPWKGFSVEIGGISIEGNRDWTTGGISRLAGFGRVSFDTSCTILILAGFIAFRRSVVWRMFVGIATLIATTATTTKGAILASLAFLVVTLSLSIRPRIPRFVYWGTLAILTILVVGIPAISLAGFLKVDIDNPVQYLLFASFVDRIENTWPHAIQLLLDSPMPWLGRGIGGIGAPQQYFEPSFYSAGDNLFMYLVVALGPASILYLAWITSTGVKSRQETLDDWRERIATLLSWMLLGLTAAPIEAATSFFLVGVVLGFRAALPGAPRQDVQTRAVSPA